MFVLGITGGMGAGKTSVAAQFRDFGWAVFDADAEVHALQSEGGAAYPWIKAYWPEVIRHGQLDRRRLRGAVVGKPEEMRRLEALMHPLVRRARHRFLSRMRRIGVRYCVLDMPLLFETGADKECSAVLVVTAPLHIRLKRIEKRRKISLQQARHLLAHQKSDTERRRWADFVVQTGLSRGHTRQQIVNITARLKGDR